jgi:hypothetical protein
MNGLICFSLAILARRARLKKTARWLAVRELRKSQHTMTPTVFGQTLFYNRRLPDLVGAGMKNGVFAPYPPGGSDAVVPRRYAEGFLMSLKATSLWISRHYNHLWQCKARKNFRRGSGRPHGPPQKPQRVLAVGVLEQLTRIA